MVKRKSQAKEQVKLTHFFRHPNYYKQLKKVREDEEKKKATSGKQQATSQEEPQATSDKPHKPESASVEDS